MIHSITKKNQQQVLQFFQEHWGNSQMIISSGVYDCEQLDGFIYEENEVILGLLTYVIHGPHRPKKTHLPFTLKNYR